MSENRTTPSGTQSQKPSRHTRGLTYDMFLFLVPLLFGIAQALPLPNISSLVVPSLIAIMGMIYVLFIKPPAPTSE